MDYSTWKYPKLKQECAKRGLGGAGKALELIMKLKDSDADGLDSIRHPLVAEPPVVETPDIPEQPIPDRPMPVFDDWDEDGRWVRRPKDFISWAEEKRKWLNEHAA